MAAARAMSVMRIQRATSGCGWLKRWNDYEQRPREVPFLFVTFSLGTQRESLFNKTKIINQLNRSDELWSAQDVRSPAQ